MDERVQKILSRAGYGSRRACEEFITSGRVTVNNEKAILGTRADCAKDTIMFDGVKLTFKEPEKVYIALYKPRNVLSDRAPGDPRQTVFSIVPDSDHLFVVGRLDYESEGLILLTNDGELANKLSHPRYGKEKEYHVLLSKRPDDEQLKAWRRGVILEDGEKTAPAQVTLMRLAGKGSWVREIMKEGRKRQIREIGKTIGLPIVKLIRVRIGTLELGNLKPREFVPLTNKQVDELRSLTAANAEKTKPGISIRTPKRDKPASERKPWSGNRSDNPSTGKGSRTDKPNSDRKSWSGNRSDNPSTGRGSRTDKPVSDRKPYSGNRSDNPSTGRGSRTDKPASDRKPWSGNHSDNPSTGRGSRSDKPTSDRKPYSGNHSDNPSTGKGNRTDKPASDRKPWSGNHSDNPSTGRGSRPAKKKPFVKKKVM